MKQVNPRFIFIKKQLHLPKQKKKTFAGDVLYFLFIKLLSMTHIEFLIMSIYYIWEWYAATENDINNNLHLV